MEVKVTQLRKYDGNGGFKGFCSVALVSEESTVVINNMSIREKDGKLLALPPSQKSEKDGKYYDIVKVSGPVWWSIQNKVAAVFNGEEEVTPIQLGNKQDEQSEDASPQAKAAAAKVAPKTETKNPFKRGR